MEIKYLSHYEQVAKDKPHSFPRIKLREYKSLVTTQVLDEKTGILVTKTEFKTCKNADNMKKFKIRDFSLENLITLGVSLQPCSTLSMSLNDASRVAENSIKNIIKDLENE